MPPQEANCSSVERNEQDIRELRSNRQDDRVELAKVQSDMKALEKNVTDIASSLKEFIQFSRSEAEKRADREEMKDKEIIKRFESLENKLAHSSFIYKIATYSVFAIVAAVVLTIVGKAVPEISKYLH